MKNFLRYMLHEFIVRFWPKWLINKITSCKDITWRVVHYDSLSLWQKIDLHWHLTFCQPCVDYKKQMALLSRGAKKFFHLKASEDQNKRLEQIAQDIIKKHTHCN